MQVTFVVDYQTEPGTSAGWRLTVTVLVSGYRLTVVVPFVVDQSPGRARDLCWLETNGYSAG